MNAITNTNTKKAAVSADVDVDANTLKLTFGAGGSVTVDANRLVAGIIRQATLHGLKQKLVDAAAISRNTDTGASASLQDKKDAVMEVYERLIGGEWNKVREGGTVTAATQLFQAIVRMYPTKSEESLRVWFDGRDDAQKATLRKNPKIAAIIAQIQAERAAQRADVAEVDSDDLLGELDGLEDGEDAVM